MVDELQHSLSCGSYRWVKKDFPLWRWSTSLVVLGYYELWFVLGTRPGVTECSS